MSHEERSLDLVELEVRAERHRQDVKWGEQNHPDGTGEGWQQAFADNAKKRCANNFANKVGTWRDILTEEVCEAFSESDQENLKTELIQVMAVCKQWIECIERRKGQSRELPGTHHFNGT